MPLTKLGRQWGWNRMRTSRRLKAWEQAGLIRRNAEAITVTGSVTPTVTEDTAAVTEDADVTKMSGAERARRSTTPVRLAAFAGPGHWLVYRPLFHSRPNRDLILRLIVVLMIGVLMGLNAIDVFDFLTPPLDHMAFVDLALADRTAAIFLSGR